MVPAGFLFRTVVGLRNLLFDYKWIESKSFRIPLISVGNITVGGTGKTPMIEYLASLLLSRYQVAVLSRGYKRKSSGFLLAAPDSSVSTVGDESRQLKLKFPQLTVAVDANRVRGIQLLKENHPALQVVLLDDAFQHRYVAPGLNILLVDYNRPPCFDSMLPAGDLREPPSSMDRADMVVVTKAPPTISPMDQRIFTRNLNLYPYQSIFFSKLEYGELKPVFENNGQAVTTGCPPERSQKALLISGIASPAPFETKMAEMMPILACKRYPDHYAFQDSDISELESMIPEPDQENTLFVTTEKDAVRLAELKHCISRQENWFYLPVRVVFIGDGESRFHKEVLKYVASNRRNSILHR